MAYVIIATFEYDTPENLAKAIPIMRAHRDRCLRDEPGTLRFEFSTVNDDDTKLILYEVYTDRQAFDTHWNGPSLKQALAEIGAADIKATGSGVHCTMVV
jgi:quinol monooxygenase YgiN